MTRAMTHGVDNAVWDFIYQVVVIGFGIAATVAVYLEISSL